MARTEEWATAPRGQVHTAAMAACREIDRRQHDIYERMYRLEALYNRGSIAPGGSDGLPGHVTENVVATNVDATVAAITPTEVRARFLTDGADWGLQRQARHMEWYAEGLSDLLAVHVACRRAFKSAAKKGTGLVHVYVDRAQQIRVTAVVADDVLLDEDETYHGDEPRNIHHIRRRARCEMLAEYPGAAAELERIGAGSFRRLRGDGMRGSASDRLMVLESYALPIGTRDKPGHRPGRHTIVVEGLDLLDEEWHESYLPFVVVRWSEREGGFYGIGLGERIAGHQRALNKRNWQIDRVLDQNAALTTYLRPADANLMVKTGHKLGTVAICKGDYPHTPTPPQVHPEVYANREALKGSAGEESGVSRMAAYAAKPAGLESGVALREYRDQTTQRFAPQERAYETAVLDTIWLVLGCCKRLGAAAPVIMRRTRFGARRIKWSDVDMADVRVQIAAASTLARTPAGRTQMVMEWAQAGIISQDETRRLLQHPDLERAMSLYTAAIENLEHVFDEIADGHVVVPEPYGNLRMAVHRGQMQYLQWRDDGAPEDVLEALRQYIVQAAYMLASAVESPAAMAVPVEAAPQAALAPQAMDLRVG